MMNISPIVNSVKCTVFLACFVQFLVLACFRGLAYLNPYAPSLNHIPVL